MTGNETLLGLYGDLATRHASSTWFEMAPEAASSAQGWTEVTFEQLAITAGRMTAYLQSAGLERGARVILQHKRAWQFFPLLAACAANELTLVPLNPELHPDELTEILRHADPRLIVGDLPESKLPVFARAQRVLTLEALAAEADGVDAVTPANHRESTQPALVIYTSGTTGGSKAVMLRERALLSAAYSNARFYKLLPDDRVFGVVPFHHMNAVMATGLIPLTSGSQVAAGEIFGFTNAKFYWQTVSERRITVCSLNPSIMSMLLKLSPNGTEADLSRVRFAWCGAAPLPEPLWRQFEETFGIPVYQGYGLTETSFWIACVPPDVPRHYETVGLPVDCEVLIERESFSSSGESQKKRQSWLGGDTPEGEEDTSALGEVLVRSGGLMDGYYRNPKLTEASITSDGFLRTGDIGFIDADGYLRIVGRKKEIIIRNGVNVLPDDVDAVVSRHPEVKECKTIGLPDELLGERIVTVCVLKNPGENITAAIRAFAREHLSTYKRPDEIIVIKSLPRGSTGKVLSATLTRIVTGEVVDEILKAVLKRRFRRAAPSDLTAMRELVRSAVREGEPIEMLSYWGCGDRDRMNIADREALETLRQLVEVVSVVPQVQARLTLILNDMHGRINGRSPERAASYLSEIAAAARAAGFVVEMESDVWREGGLQLDDIIADAGSPSFEQWWAQQPLREKLIEQATKHSRVRAPQEAARVYMQACLRANKVLEARYANSIFLTYNLPEFDIVSPDLPKLYIYPSKRGPLVKPWFDDSRDEDGAPVAANPSQGETA